MKCRQIITPRKSLPEKAYQHLRGGWKITTHVFIEAPLRSGIVESLRSIPRHEVPDRDSRSPPSPRDPASISASISAAAVTTPPSSSPKWPSSLHPAAITPSISNPATRPRCSSATSNAPATLSIDTTGVGDGAFDLSRAARLGVNLIPVNITSGLQPNITGSTHNIPKSDLIHTLEDLLHEKQLTICATCTHTEDLLEELTWFERTDHATGHVSFAAARDSIHDDLVMAASLACYRAYTQHRVALTGAGLGYGLIQQPLW